MGKAKPIGFRDVIWASLCITLGSVTGITNRVPKCGGGGRCHFTELARRRLSDRFTLGKDLRGTPKTDTPF